MAGKFPPSYMGAVIQGQALGGIFAAASNVIILSFGTNHVDAAFWDFLIAIVFLASALIAFIILTKSEFYQFYAKDGVIQDKPKLDDPQVLDQQQKLSSMAILKQIWVWILSVFLCFFVTLSVFPAITVLVKSTSSGNLWSDKYFIPVGCFLVFNIGDYVGRMLASIIKWPKATGFGSLIILVLSLLRLTFIPLFLICNAAPQTRVVTDVRKSRNFNSLCHSESIDKYVH